MNPARIQLTNAVFEGHNDVYLLDGETTALVDTGVATDAVREELWAGLADHGVPVADVDAVYLTHWHPDHSGLAAEIQAESGADVFVHEADAPLVGDADARRAYRESQRDAFRRWGIPDEERESLLAYLADHDGLAGDTPDVTTLADGDVVPAGDGRLDVMHLPGHAAGLVAYRRGREAYVGDVVLPKYTPNVGGADVRVGDPLATYVESLHRVADADFERVYPGHRDVIDRPTERTRTILRHHRERTARVVDVLSEHGPCDAWTVSAHLFGSLSGIHVMHGPGEAASHLDHLVGAGAAERDGSEYRLTDPTVDVDALVPVDTKP